MNVAERIADLIDDQRQFAASAITEIGRQRIEGVTEQPRVAQQHYPPAGKINAARGGLALRIAAQGRPIAVAMIGFSKAVERRPVQGEQRRFPFQSLRRAFVGPRPFTARWGAVTATLSKRGAPGPRRQAE